MLNSCERLSSKCLFLYNPSFVTCVIDEGSFVLYKIYSAFQASALFNLLWKSYNLHVSKQALQNYQHITSISAPPVCDMGHKIKERAQNSSSGGIQFFSFDHCLSLDTQSLTKAVKRSKALKLLLQFFHFVLKLAGLQQHGTSTSLYHKLCEKII